MFADDAAFMSTSEEGLQILVSIFNEVSDGFGLTISIKKTEVFCQKKMFKQVQENAQTNTMKQRKKKKPLKSNIQYQPVFDLNLYCGIKTVIVV